MKLTELVSLQIISLYDANLIGTISQVVFDEKLKTVKGVLLFDADETEYYLSYNKIHSINNVVVITNTDVLTNIIPKYEDLIGKEIYDTDGKDFGKLLDITFDDKGQVLSYVTQKENLENIKIIKNGVIIIFYGKVKISKKINPKLKIQQKYEISQIVKSQSEGIKLPQKINIGEINIIGKKSTIDLVGQNSELIVKKNQLITQKVISVAKRHNKINQLVFSFVN